MIKVTRLKAKDEFVLNAELIEMIEETPDTVVTLTNGKKLLVEESMEEIVRKVMQYRRAIFNNFR
jgi:flagellar protein FlbD